MIDNILITDLNNKLYINIIVIVNTLFSLFKDYIPEPKEFFKEVLFAVIIWVVLNFLNYINKKIAIFKIKLARKRLQKSDDTPQ